MSSFSLPCPTPKTCREHCCGGWCVPRAALAQERAEPDHETRAELAEQQVVQLAEERDHFRNLWQKAQQAEPLNLADPAVQKRLASQWGYVPAAQAEPVEPVDVGLLEYRGNSVAFIHQKMTAYRTGIDAAWDAFRANGLHPDGKTSLADMIAKHTAPPQRKLVPLKEEEIMHIGMTHQSLRQVARAIERAHGIKE